MFRQLWFTPISSRPFKSQKKVGSQLTDMGMSCEQSSYPEARLQKLVELRCQREVIERWMECSGTPGDSQVQLQEMLDHVRSELQTLETASPVDKDGTNINQAG
jgi:hypothetical protein